MWSWNAKFWVKLVKLTLWLQLSTGKFINILKYACSALKIRKILFQTFLTPLNVQKLVLVRTVRRRNLKSSVLECWSSENWQRAKFQSSTRYQLFQQLLNMNLAKNFEIYEICEIYPKAKKTSKVQISLQFYDFFFRQFYF